MSEPSVITDVLLFTGCAVVVASSWGMLVLRRSRARLHLLAPVTSVGGPLIAIALVIANGIGLTAGQIVLIVVLLALSGPALGIAIARAVLQRDGDIVKDSPQ